MTDDSAKAEQAVYFRGPGSDPAPALIPAGDPLKPQAMTSEPPSRWSSPLTKRLNTPPAVIDTDALAAMFHDPVAMADRHIPGQAPVDPQLAGMILSDKVLPRR